MNTAKVRLRKPNRVFTFVCNVALERGDCCVVRTERGLEYGTCVLTPEPCSDEMANRISMQVIRRATDQDLLSLKRALEEEAYAHSICLQKVNEKQLAMKLVDVEYSFDRRKVIFYFTADQRIDFRDLVRDLAHALKTRIELRHIQVRDQAKMVGGLGECGRLLCCRTWLHEFLPISMKMAKRQNLSLNPEKISGQCGRLMCCLAYENETYDAKRKKSAEPPSASKSEGEEPVEDRQPQRAQEAPGEPTPTEPIESDNDNIAEDAAPQEGAQAAPGDGTARKKRRRRKRRPRQEPNGTPPASGESAG